MVRRTSLVVFVACLCLSLGLASPAGAVVNGAPSDPAWTFVAALIRADDGKPTWQRSFCGGALIAPTWVLTAAHCAQELTDHPGGTVVIGRANLESGTNGDVRNIKSVRPSPNWSKGGGGDDIALVELDAASTQRPVPTVSVSAEPAWDGSARGTIVGWGTTATEPGPLRSSLAAKIPVPVPSSCQRYVGPQFDPSKLFCGGDMTGSACNGDSGGALYATDNSGRLVAVGLSSRGPQTCGTLPSLYTRLSGFGSWIQSITGLDPTVPMAAPTTTTTVKKPVATTAPPKKKAPTTKKKPAPATKKKR